MTKRLNTSDVLQLLEDDNFSLFEEDDSNFEGEGVESYLPRADPELSHVENSEVMEEDGEPMDFDDIVFDDSSSSSDERVTQPLGKYYCSKRYRKKYICFYVHSFWIYTKYSSPPPHRAQIPSSSDEVSSDGSELEFARSNDDDGDSSRVEDQQEQGVGVRGRGCMQPRRRDRGRRLGRGCGRGRHGSSSQAMCGMGWKGY